MSADSILQLLDSLFPITRCESQDRTNHLPSAASDLVESIFERNVAPLMKWKSESGEVGLKLQLNYVEQLRARSISV